MSITSAKTKPNQNDYLCGKLSLMFKRYWRSYPLWLQFLLLILLTFTLLSLTQGIVIAILQAKDLQPGFIEQLSKNSPRSLIDTAMLIQGVSSIGIFLLPPLLFAYLSHPKPGEYLGLRKPGRPIQWLLVCGIIAGAIPVLLAIAGLLANLNLGNDIRAAQKQQEEIYGAMLAMPSAGHFIKTLLVLAILPAICEEFFFRGLFLRFSRKSTSSMVIPILFTAAIFSFVHGTVYNFLPIFLAGVLLAVIYYLTGSLWCSILAHCVYNGSQIVIIFFAKSNPALKTMVESNTLPVPAVIIGAAIFGLSLFLLLKNKTPLPRYWAEDFTQEELSQNQL